MDFPCWLYVFALCSILPTDVHCQCGKPGPGRCHANNSQFISDREVVSPSALSCHFQGSLCNYRQGCQDEDMSPWTAGEGYSQASQKSTATCGSMTYSVLESRWIQFSIPVCLQFSFSRYSPVALAVFFEPYPTGSTEVIPLLAKERNTFLVGQIQEVNVTINKTTGKVLFRIFGGAPSNNTVLKLYPVSYQDGRCETPGCNFTGDSKQMCGWTAGNWKQATNVQGVLVDDMTTAHGAATLTSPLTRATGENHTDCLTFKFRLKNAKDSLNVALKVSGVMTTVWSANNLTSTTQMEGQVQIVTLEAYQIVFIGHKPQTDGRVIVSDVSVKANVSHDCDTKTTEAAVNVTWPLETTPSTSSGSSTAPSSTQEDQKTSDVAAIGGGVAAAVIVIIIIAVIIIVIVLRKRRRFKKDGDKRTTMAVDTEKGNGTATAAEQRDSDDYSKIPTSHFAPATPHEDNDYSAIDGVTSHPQNGDVDPYELIQDDAPGKTRPSSGEDDYNHIGISARVTSHEVVDDDYHHIHSPHQAISEPEDSYVYYPEHDTENNAAQPVLGYTYTQVNKQRGGDRTMEVDPDSNNAYCKVNKKAKQKPGLAPKPSQPKGEGDPYNIIHRSSHPEQREQTISERDDVDDEYNRLNFEDSPDRVVKPSGTAIGSYDHVRDAPDAYSKADGGKRHIVIDSGYDHLHLADD